MKRLAMIAIAAWALASVPLPASAAALLSVRAEIGPSQNPRILLTFSGGVPGYRIYGNGTSDVTLMLLGTARAVNAGTAIAGRDSLKSISLEPAGNNLDVTLHSTSPTNARVSVGGGQTLLVTLSAGPEAPSTAPFGMTPGATPPVAPPASTYAPGSSDLEVVALKYADVSEVVGLLVAGQQIPSNDNFSPQAQSFGSGGIYGSGGGFGGVPSSVGTVQVYGSASAAGSLGQQINDNIAVDRRLNAIVLTGTPDVIAGLKAKIEKIDIPLPSVVLETQVVELTDSAAKDIGIDFTNSGGPIISGSYGIKTQGTGSGTASIQLAVYDQVTRGQGKIIARPRVVAQNGSSAQIITGDALPIVTSIAVSGVNAVSQQVQYVNVGVSLQIQPRISSDGFVTSHVFSQVSSVTGYQQGYPTLSQRQATTSATVKDGESFVIGGLLQQNEISNIAKVPGIGDLPLIGGLFRLRRDRSSTTNLYIIVTPRILTTGNPPPR